MLRGDDAVLSLRDENAQLKQRVRGLEEAKMRLEVKLRRTEEKVWGGCQTSCFIVPRRGWDGRLDARVSCQ